MAISLFNNEDFILLLGSIGFIVAIGLYVTFEDDIHKAIKGFSKGENVTEEAKETIENKNDPATLFIREVNDFGKLVRNHTISSCDPGHDDGPDDWDATFVDDDNKELHINSYQVRSVPHYSQAAGDSIYWDYNKNGFGEVRENENVNLKQTVKRLNLENSSLKSQLKHKHIDVKEQGRMAKEEKGAEDRSRTTKGVRIDDFRKKKKDDDSDEDTKEETEDEEDEDL